MLGGDVTATETEAGRPPPGRSRALLWVLGGLVLVTLVIGAVVGAVRDPATLDPQSPEGVVQSYLEAVFDHDYTNAVGYLTAETAERCRPSAFRDAWVPDDLIADLDEVRVRDGQADVRVQLRSTADPLPFESMDPSVETFTLVDDDGPWRITDEPWPLHSCERPE